MSDTLTERIKYWNSTKPDDIMQAFSSDLYEIVTRAEAAEARAAALSAECSDLHETNKHLEAERDKWKRRFALNEHVNADLRNIRELVKAPSNMNTFSAVGAVINERDEARRELQHIRTLLDDGSGNEDDTALDMVKRLTKQHYKARNKLMAADVLIAKFREDMQHEARRSNGKP